MATDKEEKVIQKHMRNYGQLIQAEAEKMDLLGIETVPSLFDKATEIYFLADQIGTHIKVIRDESVHRQSEKDKK